jgi:hypothetical protein
VRSGSPGLLVFLCAGYQVIGKAEIQRLLFL